MEGSPDSAGLYRPPADFQLCLPHHTRHPQNTRSIKPPSLKVREASQENAAQTRHDRGPGHTGEFAGESVMLSVGPPPCNDAS